MIKKIFSMLMCAMTVASATTFVACGDDDNTTQPDNPPVKVSDYNIVASAAAGYYYGNKMIKSHDLNYVILFDNAEAPTKMLYLQLLSPAGNFTGTLAEGNYPLLLPSQINTAVNNGTLSGNMAIAGSVDNMGNPVYCYYTDNAGNICLLKEGTVNISKSGSEYTVEFTDAVAVLATVENGMEVTVSAAFTGEIGITDYTNVYQMNFPASTTGQLISYGDYYEQDLGVWQLTLAPQGEAGEGFRLLFLTESTNPSADISGTYIAAILGDDGSMEAGAGSFVPGSTDSAGIYGSYYMRFDASGKMTAYDLAAGGEVTISKSDDIYTVDFAIIDNASTPQTLVGTWSGTLDVQQAQ